LHLGQAKPKKLLSCAKRLFSAGYLQAFKRVAGDQSDANV
jgi:hypothetical protein